MGAQMRTASNHVGRTINLERHEVEPTIAANSEQPSSSGTVFTESAGGTRQGRQMRLNEIMEEEDGSSSWEDLRYPVGELMDGVDSGRDASLAQQYHQETSAPRREATSLLAGTDLVESLLLGNGHNCAGVIGSRDVRDGEPRSIFSFFTC